MYYTPKVPAEYFVVQLSERYRRNGKSVVVTSYWGGPNPYPDLMPLLNPGRADLPIVTFGGALVPQVAVWNTAEAAQVTLESFFGGRAAGLGAKVISVGEARMERNQTDGGERPIPLSEIFKIEPGDVITVPREQAFEPDIVPR